MRNAPRRGILLQFPDGHDRYEIDFANTIVPRVRFIFKPGDALGDPPMQDLIHGAPPKSEIGSDTLHGPAFAMQANDGEAALGRIGDLMVGRESPRGDWRGRRLGEDTFDGVRAGAAVEMDLADACNLIWGEGGVLRFEIKDRLPMSPLTSPTVSLPVKRQRWVFSPLQSSAARSWLSHSLPRLRPFGKWSPRSQRHVVIIASMSIRHMRSKS